MHWTDKSINLLRVFLRVASASLVAYLFIVVLLVATAQQKVVDALADANVGYDYSVAIDYYFGKESLQKLRGDNTRAIKSTTGDLRKANDGVRAAERTMLAQAADLEEDLQRLTAAGCPSRVPTEADPPDPAALLAAASATQHCVAESADENPRLRQVAGEVNAGADSIRRSFDDIAGLNREIEDEKDQLKLLETERDAIAGEFESAGKAAGIVAILRVFEGSRWPLASPLVYVPPALTAIILAFASGLFGALLITLVIFVYPDSQFKFTKSSSYGGRILLGGLIALGVFVLLFSGVAVLGGNESGGNSHNLMAYAAIGILSGMFSDQAAGWLSDRAVFAAQPPPGPPEAGG